MASRWAPAAMLIFLNRAPVAQLDRASGYEPVAKSIQVVVSVALTGFGPSLACSKVAPENRDQRLFVVASLLIAAPRATKTGRKGSLNLWYFVQQTAVLLFVIIMDEGKCLSPIADRRHRVRMPATE
jgi:hypothetical protein